MSKVSLSKECVDCAVPLKIAVAWHMMPQWHLLKWQEEKMEEKALVHCGY